MAHLLSQESGETTVMLPITLPLSGVEQRKVEILVTPDELLRAVQKFIGSRYRVCEYHHLDRDEHCLMQDNPEQSQSPTPSVEVRAASKQDQELVQLHRLLRKYMV